MALPHAPLALTLRLDGRPLPEAAGRALGSLVILQQASAPTACELAFVGPEAQALARSAAVGQALAVSAGRPAAPWFEGRISAVEQQHAQDGTFTLALRAYDALFTLRQRQPLRVHVGLSLAELARELVADLGLAVQADVAGPVRPRLLQTVTDFDLLADQAERCGAWLHVHDGALQLLSPQGRGAPLTLTLHRELLVAGVEHNGHGACAQVQAEGWNPWRGTMLQAQAGTPRGPAAAAAAPGGDGTARLHGLAAQDAAALEAAAQAMLDARAGAGRVLRATAHGDVRLRPGVPVQVQGLGPGVPAGFVLARVRHRIDAELGFLSEIDSTPPAPRPRPAGLAMAGARVTQIDDPDRLGRIKVALPAQGGLESDWLQWLAPGAGAAKGLVVAPDVDDLVLVLLDAADPAQALVLGSLWGEPGLPEGADALGPKASFCLLTPGGQRLRLDDDARLVRLENADGSQLELAPDRTTLRSKAPMTLEAPGQKITIRAQLVDFERA